MKRFRLLIRKLICWLIGHRWRLNLNGLAYRYRDGKGPFGPGTVDYFEWHDCERCRASKNGAYLNTQEVGEEACVVYSPYIPLYVTRPVKEKKKRGRIEFMLTAKEKN